MHKKHYNCAQNVLHAFKDKYKLSDDLIKEFRKYGFGKSPNGECGAIFTAKFLLKDDHNKAKNIEEKFLNLIGETKCKLIRSQKKFSCKDCIKTAINLLKE
ncbi:MAG: C-GCAxxG-C-C family protein [Gammaproteobacteria bacterium]|nr:C-GCAxxG-C-C family protein [Gammaproteobacteria bacterium]